MARSHGTGEINPAAFARLGAGVVFEPGALVFHAETIELGDDVYVGHLAILKGYYRGYMRIGAGTWIGQHAFLHSAGGLQIGQRVGIGPRVCILTSSHEVLAGQTPIMDAPLVMAPVTLGDGCDIGAGAVINPGVSIGEGAQIGAGAVVTRDIPAGTVASGVPARVHRNR